MMGREDRKANDLFFTCSLVAYIARRTKNKPSQVVRLLGHQLLTKIYELADVYHCDNIDRVSDDFIDQAQIPEGDFDNVAACKYAVPSHWDIGKVYKRLILMLAQEQDTAIIDTLESVYGSFICDLIEDYNSSFYYDNPQTIFQTYLNGEVIKE